MKLDELLASYKEMCRKADKDWFEKTAQEAILHLPDLRDANSRLIAALEVCRLQRSSCVEAKYANIEEANATYDAELAAILNGTKEVLGDE